MGQKNAVGAGCIGVVAGEKEALLGGNARYGDARRYSNVSLLRNVLLIRLVAQIYTNMCHLEIVKKALPQHLISEYNYQNTQNIITDTLKEEERKRCHVRIDNRIIMIIHPMRI